MMLLLLACCAIIWIIKAPYIVAWMIRYKLGETWLFHWFPPIEDMRRHMVMNLRHVNDVSFLKMLINIYPLSWLFSPIPALIFLHWARKERKHPTLIARRQFSAYQLMAVHGKNSSGVLPVAKLDLLNNPPPGWEPSTDPYTFIVENTLLVRRRTSGKSVEVELNEQRAEKIFLQYLGPTHDFKTKHWRPAEKVVFGLLCEAIFNLGKDGGIGKKTPEGWENAEKLKTALNESAYNPRGLPNLKLGEALYNKWAAQITTHPLLNKLATHFRYTSTLIYALHIETTEKGIFDDTVRGVFTTNEMRWLKPVDRKLFYALNNTGRKVAWTEAGAVYTQYNAERKAMEKNRILGKPYMLPAIESLQTELEEIGISTPKSKE